MDEFNKNKKEIKAKKGGMTSRFTFEKKKKESL